MVWRLSLLVLVDVEKADTVQLWQLGHHADGHHGEVDDEMHFVVARVQQREEEDDDWFLPWSI